MKSTNSDAFAKSCPTKSRLSNAPKSRSFNSSNSASRYDQLHRLHHIHHRECDRRHCFRDSSRPRRHCRHEVRRVLRPNQISFQLRRACRTSCRQPNRQRTSMTCATRIAANSRGNAACVHSRIIRCSTSANAVKTFESCPVR